jgi:hypothetical protein
MGMDGVAVLAVWSDSIFGVDKLSMFSVSCDSLLLEVVVLAVMICTCLLGSLLDVVEFSMVTFSLVLM